MPPHYFSKLTTLAKRGSQGRDSDLKALVGFLAEHGKTLLGNPRFFYFVPAAALAEIQLASRTGSSLVARSDPNQKRSPSIVDAISRTVAIPSVSGQSYRICGFHIDQLLDDVVGSSTSSKDARSIKAATIPSARKALLISSYLNGFCSKSQEMSVLVPHGNIQSVDSHSESFKKQQALVKKQEVSVTNLVHRQLCNLAVRIGLKKSYSCGGVQGFHTSTFASVFAGAASEESLDTNISGDAVESSVASQPEQSIPLEKPLKLLCGSCYLPHPDKEETGGEDAHFICLDKQVFGVADGVGGWADLGVNAGLYSRELMENAEAAVHEEPLNAVDPARVLEKAHAKTKAKGSSTACIIALTDQGLHAVNLGDSGFVVIRDGSTVFKSPVQQHDFNFTYQLESGGGDLPSSGEVFKIPVSPGDVIVAGTDGLFDNLYNNEVSGVVVHSVRAGFGPQIAARKIAALARERALDKNRQTPFATAAQDAGFRYHGGKLDDITVIVSYITRSADGNGSGSAAN